ncbi:hypothetical protein BESB_071870 [Besnoitia besnoiti]|uniref:Transmembrane protein n=1 Tax=Besnoitia besnoiti TaxID=94643 RepID=A0A2A9M7R0_BESBE|nr:uncharacterized protein BESB_071870 [Besnoitia besnoiti]PFH34035.1 hypothetical protein BESB_071870 [Besnoitia besnoiti]
MDAGVDSAQLPRFPGVSFASAAVSPLPNSPLFSSPSELLYILFPLIVLFVCFHAISSNSPSSPSLSISASIRAFRLHLATVHHTLPSSFFSLTTFLSPCFLSLLAPYLSFFVLRLLPLCFSEPPVPPSAVAISYRDLFLSPAVFAPAAEGSTATPEDDEAQSSRNALRAFVSFLLPEKNSYSPLGRFLLHPFYLSPTSVVFWLFAGPFLLYSCALYIQQKHVEASRGMSVVHERRGDLVISSSPKMRSIFTILICLYLPGVLMTWVVTQVFPSASAAVPYRYLGIEGAVYALAFVVFFYDPVVYSGMFADPSIQFPLPFHVRSVTIVFAFTLFLFSPPPGDLVLLLCGVVSAILAVAATCLPPSVGVAGAIGGVSLPIASLVFEERFGALKRARVEHSLFFVPYAPQTSFDSAPECFTWTVAGLVFAIVGGMALAGLLWRAGEVIEGAVNAVRDSAGVRVRLTSVVVMLAFTYLPFSFSSLPSLSEFVADPLQTLLSLPFGGPSLYEITCTERTVLLGSIGAKTLAFWTPFFGFSNRSPALKYFIGPLLWFLLFVGMASEHWRRVGPGFLGTAFALYCLFALPRAQ